MTDSQPTPINDQLNALDTIDSSYDKRKAIDELDQGITYSVTVVIDKIAKNYSYVREDGYRDAYYITGAISGSEHRVKVLLPTAMNSEVESWSEGETRVLLAIISDWDLAYKQFGLLGHRSIVAETEVDSVADEVAESTPDSAVGVSDSADETDALASNTNDIGDATERDAQSEGSKEQDDAIEPAEEPIVVDEVETETAKLEPKPVEPVEEPVIGAEVQTDDEEPEPVEPAETNQAEDEVIDLESKVAQPEDPKEAPPVNQEIENFIVQMEAPTPLEQLAEDYAEAQPSDSEDKISVQTAIPVLGDVPILKGVPIRGAVSTARQPKRFSSHTPVRPIRRPTEVKEDEAQDQTKKIIKITVGVCVGIVVLMCLCCGVFSQASG
jgi:hypothetical protein